MSETITAPDGHSFAAYVAAPDGPPRAGLVILQEIFGVTDQLRDVAETYADEGYLVAVPALFDRQAPGHALGFDEVDAARALMLGADPDKVMTDISATVDWLTSRAGAVGVIGFCWGGGLALRCAQLLPVGAAVAFYGTRIDSYLDQPLKAPFLGHFGTQDTHTPSELIARAQAALPDMSVEMYEAGHAFANDQRPAYVPEAAELAHDRTRAFFDAHLK